MATCCSHDDARLLQLRVGLERIENLETVEPTGHHHGEHGEIGLFTAGDIQSAYPILSFEYFECGLTCPT